MLTGVGVMPAEDRRGSPKEGPAQKPPPAKCETYHLVTGEAVRLESPRAGSPQEAHRLVTEQLGTIPGGLLAWAKNSGDAEKLADAVRGVRQEYRHPWGINPWAPSTAHCTVSRGEILTERREPRLIYEWQAVEQETFNLLARYRGAEKECGGYYGFNLYSNELLRIQNHLAIHPPSERGVARPLGIAGFMRGASLWVVLAQFQAKGEGGVFEFPHASRFTFAVQTEEVAAPDPEPRHTNLPTADPTKTEDASGAYELEPYSPEAGYVRIGPTHRPYRH
jgi:hypothetical protein